MKNSIKILLSLALSVFVYAASMAQDQSNDQNQDQDMKNDKDITKMAEEDLVNRYPELNEEIIVWDHAEDSYNATYSLNEANYMARYDSLGTWIETLQKREWDDNVPEHVQLGFDNSPYESYDVDSYWEISDSDRGKGYLLYVKDEDGNTQHVRMDSQGMIINENEYNNPK